MKALVLAAGYATRLYPLTLDKAKPLLPIGKKTMIDYVVDKIEKIQKVDIVYVVTNQKFFSQFNDWALVRRSAKKITVINDETTSNEDRLGAIGDIALVVRDKKIKDDLLVVAGDNLFEFDLKEFVDFANKKSPFPSIAVYDIKEKEQASLYGVLEINGNNKILSFEEKPGRPKSTLVSTAVYYFPEPKLKCLDSYFDISKKNDAPGNYIKWLVENESVYAFTFDEAWYDIGDRASYEKVKNMWR